MLVKLCNPRLRSCLANATVSGIGHAIAGGAKDSEGVNLIGDRAARGRIIVNIADLVQCHDHLPGSRKFHRSNTGYYSPYAPYAPIIDKVFRHQRVSWITNEFRRFMPKRAVNCHEIDHWSRSDLELPHPDGRENQFQHLIRITSAPPRCARSHVVI